MDEVTAGHVSGSEYERQQNPTITVDTSEMRPVSFRPDFATYVKDLWGRRFFIWEEAKGKTSTNNRDLILGRAWNVINPLLNAAMYGIIFGLLLKTSRGIENFIGYLVIGIVFFGFMRQGLTGGAGLMQSSRGLVSSFNFPRAAMAASVTTKNFLQNITPALVAICFGLAFQFPEVLKPTAILVVPLYFLIHLFACGLTLIVARMTAFVPDLKSLLSFFARAWFYTSGVFFSFDRFTTNTTVQQILELNPAFQYLKAVRGVVLYGELPSVEAWIYMCLCALFSILFGLIYFWRAEARYSNVR
ncbi:ABC transporter permease [Corynebacterium sp. HMSC071B10]|uniref:ABC transporter permease n=1 Tax=Corynebacterium sp. HMSC071B10 TaxID=1739494 RepID=UPI0008A2C823|nr:ABC transporter permease [Corynebacterium sp. HMSC071B10]